MAQDNPFGHLLPSATSPQPSVQRQGQVFTLPPNPKDIQAAAVEAERLRLAREAAARSADNDAREVPKTAFQQASSLRDDFSKRPENKEYQTVIRQYATALQTKPTPTGDQALITAYAKMLDPGSVVREQEFNTVANADSAIGQLQAQLKKQLGMDDAGLLRPEIRDRVRGEMLNLTKNYNESYKLVRQQYRDIAQRSGINPDDVIGPHIGSPFYDDIEKALKEQRKPPPAGVPAATESGAPYVGMGSAAGQDYPMYGEKPSEPSPPQGSFGDSYVGQGMSGANEGLASIAGLPVDAATWAMNLVPRGLNAAANTDIPEITDPFLGSDWIKNKFSEVGATHAGTNDPNKQFVRRVGQSIGAASVPLAGAAGSIGQFGRGMLSAASGGVGGATAQRVAPGNPLAEFAGEMAGSGLSAGGMFAAGRRTAQRKIEAGVPTVDQLKAQAGNLYQQAESRGVTADPAMTQQLSDDLRSLLKSEGKISPVGRINETFPKAKEAIQLADDYAGQTMNPTQIQTVRKATSDGMSSVDPEERRLSGLLTDTFDDWASPQAPELAQARDISSRYIQAQKLERARELAAANAGQFTGSGFENALRNQYRQIDRATIKGSQRYSDDLNSAIQNVGRGTPGANLAREVGKYAPTGVVSSGLGAGGAFLAGNAAGGPALGAALGLTVGGAGSLGRVAATRMGIRNADLAELTARNGGALPQAPLLDPDVEKAVLAALAGQSANVTANSGMFGSRRKQEDTK